MFKEQVKNNRSYRIFDESIPITEDLLLDWIDTARFSAASVNIQPLKYLYSCEREKNNIIFPLTAWARMLPDFPGPPEGKRPTAYIVICTDKEIAPNVERFATDVGIVAQTIMLAAVEKGFGGCMIGNYSKKAVTAALQLPENLEPSLILALGKPAQKIVLEDIPRDGKTPYYLDGSGVHHVPKRMVDEIAARL